LQLKLANSLHLIQDHMKVNNFGVDHFDQIITNCSK
jgi:hypothetical protein